MIKYSKLVTFLPKSVFVFLYLNFNPLFSSGLKEEIAIELINSAKQRHSGKLVHHS